MKPFALGITLLTLSLFVPTPLRSEGPGAPSDEAKLFYTMGYLDGRNSALADFSRMYGLKESDPGLNQLDAQVSLAETVQALREFYANKKNEKVPLRQALKTVLSRSGPRR